jgi:hypothetical protein
MRPKVTKDEISIDQIDHRILLIRGRRVMIDSDLAALYDVSTGRFNEQVKRNLGRFPADFMFQLTNQEAVALRSQFAISNERAGRGGRRYLPYAFTEHGAIMAATILNTPRATEVSVYVVRAFLRLREIVASSTALSKKLDALERKVTTHDRTIGDLIQAIRQLTVQPEPKRRPIGFVVPEDTSGKSARRK